ncbi:MAG: hypothetical protein APR54_06935 [Candidatus Cloacimonas sp. SDB]|nr:MAG: hypothetical protein APR54_06935 [Candidatus Cloacimonas sp. SDB]
MKIIIISIIFFLCTTLNTIDYTISPNAYTIQSGDFDNDGHNEIVVGHNYNEGVLTFIDNSGNAHLEIIDVISSNGAVTVSALGNLDNENGIDIVSSFQENSEGTEQLKVFYNFDIGNPYYYDTNDFIDFFNFSSGDFDNDNDNDIVVSSHSTGSDNLWGIMYNMGNREFTDPVWYECPSQAPNAHFTKFICKDLDNNWYDDIIAFSFANTYIYYFDHSGFSVDSLNYEVVASGIAVDDFDNDNDYDIIVVHWPIMTQDNLKIYENIGNQEFYLHTYYIEDLWAEPKSCDLNNDGLIDILTVGDEIKKYFNEGNLNFSSSYIQDYPDYGESSVNFTLSDLDGNSIDDLAIIRYGISENNLTILFNNGEGEFVEDPVGCDEFEIKNLAKQFSVFPNPFNPSTEISFSVEEDSHIKVSIYNTKGQLIKNFEEEFYNVGDYSITWNGKDNSDNDIPSGIYLINLLINDRYQLAKKCVLLK